MGTLAKMVDPLRTGRAVAALAWIWLVADLLLALQSLFTVYALGGIGSAGASHDLAVLSDQTRVPAGLASTATNIVAGIAILRWVYVVNRNAHALGGTMAITPAMNVVWFFIPIGNFWKPFTGVRESWQATLNPAAPERVPVPAVMRCWWGAWLISSLVGNVSGRLEAAASTADEIIRANWLIVLSTPIDLAAAVTLLTVVRRLSRLQSRALAQRDAATPGGPAPDVQELGGLAATPWLARTDQKQTRGMADGASVVGSGAVTDDRMRRRRLLVRRLARRAAFAACFAPVAVLMVAELFQAPPSRPLAGVIGKHGIIGRDDRRLLSEATLPGAADQAAARKGLGATQRLSCGATASLVYRADVIVFSAHQLLDHDKPDPAVASCMFEVTRIVDGEPKTERYPLLLDTLDHGALAGKAWTEGNVQDWAVARLARPVPDVEPYGLPAPGDDDQPGTPVTFVSDTTDNWDGPSGPADRLVQSCRSIKVDPDLGGSLGVMHFDCDVGRGASGGAVLSAAASGHPRYLGTIIAYSGSDCAEPGSDTCFAIARKLDPDLVARVRGTTALGSPEDRPFAEAQAARLETPRREAAQAAAAALAAPFPAGDDDVGRTVASLFAEVQRLDRSGRGGEADAVMLRAYAALADPDRKRPEWPALLIESAGSLQTRGRGADAFQCLRMAEAVAPDALKPALRLRMALVAPQPAERDDDLRQAYLAGGAQLFHDGGADRELDDIRARGVPTSVRDDD